MLPTHTTTVQSSRQGGSGFVQSTTPIVLLTIGVVTINFWSTRAAAVNDDFIDLDPDQIESAVGSIAPYTESLEEEGGLVRSVAEGQSTGFLTKTITLETKRVPTQYQVQRGDTLSSIAQKSGVTVATILESNQISADRVLKVGEDLTIPPETTSTSLAWLEDLKKKQQEQERIRAKLRNQSARDSGNATSRNRRSTVERSSQNFDGSADELVSPAVSSKGISRGLSRFHTGIDIRMDIGSPVVAAGAGRVVEITDGWGRGWGKSIAIDHGDGITTRYAHLSNILVSLNDLVEQRQTIGLSGNSGRSTGPHLHFEERVNGRPVVPDHL